MPLPRRSRSAATLLLAITAVALVSGTALAQAPPAATWVAKRTGVPAPRALDAVTPADFPPGDTGYHTYAEMAAEVLQVQTAHPGIVRRFSLGTSYRGRELWAAKVTTNVDGNTDARPAVLFDGLHHAREHLSAEMALSILHLLADDYSDDTALGHRVKAILDRTVVYIVFMVDPDGGEYDITGGSCGPNGGYRCWRKDRQPNAGTNAVGTDVNRNYGYAWGCCGGSSGSPSSEYYRGPAPFSTLEAQRVRDFVNGRIVNGVNQIRAHISFHTAGLKVLWPYGHTYTDVPRDMTMDDHAVFVKLGQAMAATNGYTPEQSSAMYITDGDEIDWLYGVHRVFSYTFEMGPAGTTSRSYPSDEAIVPETTRNREAVLYLLEHAACPYSVLGSAAVAAHCGAFSDDFEIYRGSMLDPDGTDTATGGAWERGMPQSSTSGGHTLQPGSAVSGRAALVTGRTAGSSASAGDLDGRTTVRTRSFRLVAGRTYTLRFRGYLAHDAASTAADYLRISLLPPSGAPISLYRISGSAARVDAAWTARSRSFTVATTGTYRLLLEAQDGGPGNLVEAGIDDLSISPR